MSLNTKYSLGILLTFVLLALVMLYVLPFVNYISSPETSFSTKFLYSRIILWIVLLSVILYSLFFEKSPILLWKEKKYSFVFYLVAIISLYFICMMGGGILNAIITVLTHEKISGKLIQLRSVFKDNYFLIVFTCLTAGVVEEVLMRGYIQPRIEKIYNSPFLGVFVSAILFGILHSTYGTIGQVAVPFFIGIIFAIFYKTYSNIKILIMCHFLYDFVSLMVMNFIDIKHLSAL